MKIIVEEKDLMVNLKLYCEYNMIISYDPVKNDWLIDIVAEECGFCLGTGLSNDRDECQHCRGLGIYKK